MMALQDDQYGQSLEAVSPSKRERNITTGAPAQNHRPPKMGALSVPVRPSSAAMARTTAFPDVNISSRNRRPSPDRASFDETVPLKSIPLAVPPASRKEDRGAGARAPIPFMLAPQRWDSDVSMKDGSSNFSGLSRFERDLTGLGSKTGSAHAPSKATHMQRFKAGLTYDTDDSLDLDVRCDQSLLRTVDVDPAARTKAVTDDPDRTPRDVANHVEVIDVDEIHPGLIADLAKLSPFKPGHKAGMSSVSSTGRLERQLYSALGEELGSFEQQMDPNGMDLGLAQVLSGGSHGGSSGSTMLEPNINECEPLIKRKRQGTLGGDRDRSPAKKKERARPATVEEEGLPDDMPRLRDD